MPHARLVLGSAYLVALLLVCSLHGDAALDIVCDTELGIATGGLPDANINATSSAPGTQPSDVRYDSTGWCPSEDDSDPCIEFRFNSPKALRTFTFRRKDGGEYMETWGLQTRDPGAEEFRTRFTNVPALNATTVFNVTIKPPLVVEAFRICPLRRVGKACFRFRLTGCADNNELCPNVTCPANGTCMGLNYCRCPDALYGSDCSIDGTTDVRTYVSFASSEILANNTIISDNLPTLTLLGLDGTNASVALVEGFHAMAVHLKGTNVYASLPGLSCFDNLQVCSSFTLSLVAAVQFEESNSTFSLLSSNNLSRQQGVQLSVQDGQLNAVVLAGQYMWRLTIENVLQDVCLMERDPGLCKALNPSWYYSSRSRECFEFNYGGCGGNGNRFSSEDECEQICKESKSFKFISGQWYRFVFSWNSRGGLELYANGRLIGRQSVAEILDSVAPSETGVTAELYVGSSVATTDIKFESIEFWPLQYSEVLMIGNFNGYCGVSDCDGIGSIGCYDNATCICRKGYLGSLCDQTVDSANINIITFSRIESSTLYSSMSEFSVTGDITLETQNTSLPILQLAAGISYVTSTFDTGCIGDLSCKNGFTFSVQAQLLSGSVTLLSVSSAETNSSCSLAYDGTNLVATAIVNNRLYNLSFTYAVVSDTWVSFEVSFSKVFGFSLVIDENVKASTNMFVEVSRSFETYNLTVGSRTASTALLKVTSVSYAAYYRSKLQFSGVSIASPCPMNYCRNGGVCTGVYQCACSDGYFGAACDLENKDSVTMKDITLATIKESGVSALIKGKYTIQNNNALELDSTSERSFVEVDFSSSTSCLTRPQRCWNGFTMSLSFSITQMSENSTVILLSTGGDPPSGKDGIRSGVYVAYNIHKQYEVNVRTPRGRWSVKVPKKLSTNKEYKIGFSWSFKELSVFVDNVVIASTTTHEILDRGVVTKDGGNLRIGSGYGDIGTSKYILRLFNFKYYSVSRSLLSTLKIVDILDETEDKSKPCDSDPCENGKCTNKPGNSFECSCYYGYRGDKCDTKMGILINRFSFTSLKRMDDYYSVATSAFALIGRGNIELVKEGTRKFVKMTGSKSSLEISLSRYRSIRSIFTNETVSSSVAFTFSFETKLIATNISTSTRIVLFSIGSVSSGDLTSPGLLLYYENGLVTCYLSLRQKLYEVQFAVTIEDLAILRYFDVSFSLTTGLVIRSKTTTETTYTQLGSAATSSIQALEEVEIEEAVIGSPGDVDAEYSLYISAFAIADALPDEIAAGNFTLEMCSQGFCQNGGVCDGPDHCMCNATLDFTGPDCSVSGSSIKKETITFTNNGDGSFSTSSGSNVTVHGSVSVTTTNISITASSSGSFIEVDSSGTPCLSDPSSCSSGFTICIQTTFTRLVKDSHICLMSTGGQALYGLSLTYDNKKKQFLARVSVPFRTWELKSSFEAQLNVDYDVCLSWSMFDGISVVIDNQVSVSNVFKTSLTRLPGELGQKLRFGSCYGVVHTDEWSYSLTSYKYYAASIQSLAAVNITQVKVKPSLPEPDVEEVCDVAVFRASLTSIVKVGVSLFSMAANARTAACTEFTTAIATAQASITGCWNEKDESVSSSSLLSFMRYSLRPNVLAFKSLKSLMCDDLSVSTDAACDFGTISSDIQVLFTSISSGQLTAMSCKSVTNAFLHIKDKLKTCSPETMELLTSVMVQLRTTVSSVCAKSTCNIEYSKSCVSEASTVISSVTEGGYTHAVCKKLKQSLSCVTNHTIDCNRDTYSRISTSVEEVRKVYFQNCFSKSPKPSDPVDCDSLAVDEVDTILSLQTLVSSRLFTQKTLCSLMTANMKWFTALPTGLTGPRLEKFINARNFLMTQAAPCFADAVAARTAMCSCNITAVQACAQDAQQLLDNTTSSCREIQRAVTCLRMNSDCTGSDEAAADAALSSLTDKLNMSSCHNLDPGSICPSPLPCPSNITSVCTDPVCSEEFLRCVDSQSGCGPFQKMFQLFRTRFRMGCPQNETTTLAAYNYQHADLETCFAAIEQIRTTDIDEFCNDITMFKSCLDAKDFDPVFQFYLDSMKDTSRSFIENVCSEDSRLNGTACSKGIDYIVCYKQTFGTILDEDWVPIRGIGTCMERGRNSLMASCLDGVSCGDDEESSRRLSSAKSSIHQTYRDLCSIATREEVNRGCNVAMATQCSTKLASRIFSGDGNLCGAVSSAKDCVHVQTSQCPEAIRRRFHSVVTGLQKLTAKDCCVKAQSKTCDPAGAVTCVLDIHHLAKMPAPDWEGICKKVNSSMECMRSFTDTCEECEKDTVHYIVERLNRDIVDTCRRPPEGTCKVTNALTCVEKLKTFAALRDSSENWEDFTCLKVQQAETCISEYMKECDRDVKFTLEYQMSKVVRFMEAEQCRKVDTTQNCVDILRKRIEDIIGYDPKNAHNTRCVIPGMTAPDSLKLEECRVSITCDKGFVARPRAADADHGTVLGFTEWTCVPECSDGAKLKLVEEKKGSHESGTDDSKKSWQCVDDKNSKESGKNSKESEKNSKESGKNSKESGKNSKESGTNSKETGKETGMNIKEAGKSIKETGNGSKETGKGSKETGKEAGKSSKETGKNSKETGKETGKSSKETGKNSKETGKETGKSSKETGKNSKETGKETGKSSKETGKNSKETGKETGKTSKESGKNSKESGKNSHSSKKVLYKTRLEKLCAEARVAWSCVEHELKDKTDSRATILFETVSGLWEIALKMCDAQEEPPRCYSCDNALTNDECNLNMEECNSTQSVCMTRSKYDESRVLTSLTKRCVAESRCIPGCKDGVCTFCCTGPKCNVRAEGPIKPICSLSYAAKCAFRLAASLSSSKEIQCSVFEAELKCMREVREQCVSDTQSKLFKLTETLYQSVSFKKCKVLLAPPTCSVHSVVSLGLLLLAPEARKEDVCRNYDATMLAVTHAKKTTGCYVDVIKRVDVAMTLIRTQLRGYGCRGIDGFRLDCNKEKECSIPKASECLKGVSSLLAAQRWSDKKELCRKYLEIRSCLESSRNGCTDRTTITVAQNLWEQFESATEAVADQCEAEIKAASCDPDDHEIKCRPMDAVTKCFNGFSLRSVFSECQNLRLAHSCIMRETANCLPIQRKLSMTLLYLQPDMPAIMARCGKMPDPEVKVSPYAQVLSCMGDFAVSLKKALMSPSESLATVCTASIEVVQRCMARLDLDKQAKLSPLENLYLRNTYMTLQYLEDAVCEDAEPKPALNVSETCLGGYEKASTCLSVQTIGLMIRPFLPTTDVASFCGNFYEIETCVETSLDSCTTEERGAVGQYLDVVREKSVSVCMSQIRTRQTCSPRIASACLFSLSAYMETGTITLDNQCRMVDTVLACVKNHIVGCQENTTLNIRRSLKNVVNKYGRACPAEVRSLICHKTDPSTTTSTCGLTDSAAMATCLTRMVSLKIRPNQFYELQTCWVLNQAYKCVRKLSADCSEAELGAAWSSIQGAASAISGIRFPCADDFSVDSIRSTCPLRAPTCSIMGAIACLRNARESFTGFDVTTIARDSASCVWGNVTGCSALQQAIFSLSITNIFGTSLSLTLSDDITMMPFYTLLTNFNGNVTLALSKPTYNHLDLCFAAKATLSEFEQVFVSAGTDGLGFEKVLIERGRTMLTRFTSSACNDFDVLDQVLTYEETTYECKRFAYHYSSVLVQSIFSGFLSMEDTAALCRAASQMEKVNQATVMASCSAGFRQQMAFASRLLKSTVSGVCKMPRVCNLKHARYCISRLSITVAHYGLNTTQEDVCNALQYTDKCVEENTFRCAEVSGDSFKAHYAMERSVALDVCGGVDESGFIPRCKVKSKEFAGKCSPRKAERCLRSFVRNVVTWPILRRGKQCVEFTKAQHCLQKTAQSCVERGNQLSFNGYMNKMKAFFGENTCNVAEYEEECVEGCELQEAELAIYHLKLKLKSLHGSAACAAISDARLLLMSKSSQCSTVVKLRLKQILDTVLRSHNLHNTDCINVYKCISNFGSLASKIFGLSPKEPERSSKETGKSSKETGMNSKDTGKNSKETGKSSKETGKETGKSSKETGKETGMNSKETGKNSKETGKETGKSSKETGKETGMNSKETGKSSKETGKETGKSSKETGKETGMNSKETGKSSKETGKETGKSSKETGKETGKSSKETGKETGMNSKETGKSSKETGKETGKSSKETGKETGKSSKESGKSSKETGKETGMNSKETGKSSKETGKETGKSSKETGKETGKSSKETGKNSKETGKSSKETGKNSKETGKEAGKSSKETGKNSKETGKETGKSSKETGKNSKETGKETGNSSKETGKGSPEHSTPGQNQDLSTLCLQAREAWECVETGFHLVPSEHRRLIKTTLQAVWKIVQHRCANTVRQSCYSCDGALTSDECNTKTMLCGDQEQMCQSIVKRGEDNRIRFYKTCVRPSLCKMMCSGSGDNCRSYCCVGNLCNREYNFETPIEPVTCRVEKSVSCALSLVRNIVNFGEVKCSTSRRDLECVGEYTRECRSPTLVSLSSAAFSVMSMISQSTCKVEVASSSCGSKAILSTYSILKTGFATLDDTICRGVTETILSLQRIEDKGVCTLSELIPVRQSLSLIKHQTAGFCGTGGMSTAACNARQPTSDTQSGTAKCGGQYLTTARCLAQAIREFTDKGTAFCSTFQSTASCLDKLTGCSIPASISNLNMTLSDMVKTNCTSPSESFDSACPASVCQLTAARACYETSVLTDIPSGGSICDNLRVSRRCILSNTSGCLSIQEVVVLQEYKTVAAERGASCQLEELTMKQDIFTDLSTCLMTYANALTSALSSSDMIGEMCAAHAASKTCTSSSALPILSSNFTKSAVKTFNKGLGDFLEDKCRSDDSQTDGRKRRQAIMQNSCDLDRAGRCLRSYLLASFVFPTTPLSDRPARCRDMDALYQCVMESSDTCLTRTAIMSILSSAKVTFDEYCSPRQYKTGGCDLEMVTESLSGIQQLVTSAVVATEDMCSNTKNALGWVKKFSRTCSDATILSSITTYLGGLVGNTCPRLTVELFCGATAPITRSCDFKRAQTCVNNIDLSIDAEADTENFCNGLLQNVTCTRNNLDGCLSSEIAEVSVKAKANRDVILSKSCSIDADLLEFGGVCTARPVCSLSGAYRCLEDLLTQNYDLNDCTIRLAKRNCMATHLQGCNQIQISLVTAMFEILLPPSTACSAVVLATSPFSSTGSTSQQEKVTCLTDLLTSLAAFTETSTLAPRHDLCRIFSNYSNGCGSNVTIDVVKEFVETNCTDVVQCPAGERFCSDGACYPVIGRCNGTTECSDGSDEMDCGVKTDAACQIREGSFCVMKQLSSTIMSKFLSVGDKKAMCSQREKTSQCIQARTNTCPGTVKAAFQQTLTVSEAFVKSQGTCTLPRMCIEEQTFACINQLAVVVAKTDITTGTKDVLCNQFLQTKSCVEQFSATCTDAAMGRIRSKYNSVVALIDGQCDNYTEPEEEPEMLCPDIAPEDRKCEVFTAFNCLLGSYTNLINNNPRNNLENSKSCFALQSTIRCVAANISGCKEEDAAEVIKSLSNLRDSVKDRCMLYDTSLCGNPQPCPVGGAGCVKTFQKELSSHPEKDVCELITTARTCISHNTVDCSPQSYAIADYSLKKAIKDMKTQVRCDGNSADSCILTFQTQAYRILSHHETTTPTMSLADQCSVVQVTRMCINDKLSTTRVGEGMDTIVSRLWRNLNATVVEVCEGAAPTCPLGAQANVLLSLLVKLATNPSYTKQAFCSEVPLMLSRVSRADLESCGTSNSFSVVLQYLQESYATKCQTTVTCEQARTDGNTCLNEITATSSCGDVKRVQACLGKAIGQCSNTSDTLMASFRSKLAILTTACTRLPVISHSLSTDNTIYLAEGGPSVKLTLRALGFTDVISSANAEIRLKISFDLATPSIPRCPNNNAIQQVASDKCQIIFDASNNGDEQSFEVSAVLDNTVDGYQQVEATVTMERWERNPLQEIASETLGPFTIQVQDRDGKSAICSSINDPHLRTFDGRMYNYMGTGTFIMYENRPDSESRGSSPIKLQVQTKFQTCGTSGSCNCAVYILVDNDVIVFDICGNSGVFTPLKVDIKIRGDMTDAVKIMTSADHKTYQVVMATGQIVKVRASNNHLNVWILASASDRGNTRGLCGMFDGDRYNDLTQPDGSLYQITDADIVYGTLTPDNYTLQWRVVAGSEADISNGVQVDVNDTSLPSTCQCGSTGTCNQFARSETCGLIRTGDIDITSQLMTKSLQAQSITDKRRRKRQAETVPETFVNSPQPGWPTSTGWTEQNATDFCQQKITDALLNQKCSEAAEVANNTADIDQNIRNCVDDIRNTGTTDFTVETNEDLKETCISGIDKDPIFQTDTQAREIAAEIMNLACTPVDCNGNGRCEGGICVCNSGYLGTDCSINKQHLQPPILYGLEHFGLCEFSDTQACTDIFVSGRNFVESELLKCHIEIVEISENGFTRVPGNMAIMTSARLVTETTVHCTISAVRGANLAALVAISNDGMAQSQKEVFIAYDPACQQCDHIARKCYHQDNTCNIAGQCYTADAVSANNTCVSCQPMVSKTQWTTIDGEVCKTEEPLIDGSSILGLKETIGIGVACAVVLFILLAVIVKLACMRRSRAEQKRMDRERYPQQPEMYVNPAYQGSDVHLSSFHGEPQDSFRGRKIHPRINTTGHDSFPDMH